MTKSDTLNSFGALLVPLFIISGKIFVEREAMKKRYSFLGILLTVIGFLFFLNEIETTRDKKKYILWVWLFLVTTHFLVMFIYIEKEYNFQYHGFFLNVASWGLLVWFLSKNDFNRDTQYIMFSVFLILISNLYFIPQTVKRASVLNFSFPMYAIGWTLLSMVSIF